MRSGLPDLRSASPNASAPPQRDEERKEPEHLVDEAPHACENDVEQDVDGKLAERFCGGDDAVDERIIETPQHGNHGENHPDGVPDGGEDRQDVPDGVQEAHGELEERRAT